MGFFYYKNQSTNFKKLDEKVTMTTLENLKICHPHQNDSSYEVSVLPNDDCMVIYKCVRPGEPYTFSTKTNSSVETCTRHEVENHVRISVATTIYIDDPNDKGANGALENSFYDKYILKDANPDEKDVAKMNAIEQNRKQNVLTDENLSVGNPFAGSSSRNFPQQERRDVFPINLESASGPGMDSPFLQKELNLQSINIWANLPKYLKDNGELGILNFQNFEITAYNFLEPFGQYPLVNIITTALLALFLILPLIVSFLREDATDFILGWFLIGLVAVKHYKFKIFANNNIILRFYPWITLLSTIGDIYYLAAIAQHGFFIFSFLLLLAKVGYSISFWYKTIETIKDSDTTGIPDTPQV